VLHPRVVRTLPCLQAPLAVKAPHQILMAWNQSQSIHQHQLHTIFFYYSSGHNNHGIW
jgi:hypothetical protein